MVNKYIAKFAGTGSYLPTKVVNNFDLEKKVDTSDEWIRSMTGMSERRFAAENEAASDLATNAAKKAIEAAGIKAKDIDLIIVATISGDHAFPSTACIVQNNLGLKGFPAFDISAGCTGFIFGADMARQYIENGAASNVLVIGVEVLSRIINWEDRGTCVLFADGAGAAIISRADSTDISNFMDSSIGSDGTQHSLLVQEAGGSRHPASQETIDKNLHTISMQGNRIFKNAIKSMYSSCDTIFKRNNIDVKTIDWLIPHQANIRIIEGLGKKLKIDTNKVIVNIEKYANTSAATVPIALDEAVKSNKIRRGDLVAMTAFGAGLTTGCLLFRY